MLVELVSEWLHVTQSAVEIQQCHTPNRMSANGTPSRASTCRHTPVRRDPPTLFQLIAWFHATFMPQPAAKPHIHPDVTIGLHRKTTREATPTHSTSCPAPASSSATP